MISNRFASYNLENEILHLIDKRPKFERRSDLHGMTLDVTLGVYFPWVFLDDDTGQYMGRDIITVKNLARRLNFEIRWLPNPDDVYM